MIPPERRRGGGRAFFFGHQAWTVFICSVGLQGGRWILADHCDCMFLHGMAWERGIGAAEAALMVMRIMTTT